MKAWVGAETALEEQAHRVAFVSEGRLQPHKHIAELRTQNENAAAIRLYFAGGRAPLAFNLVQPGSVADNCVSIHVGGDIGLLAVLLG